jgi:restriction-modification enzyme MmeI-like protein
LRPPRRFQPDPSTANTADNAYVFERDVTFDQGDGTTTTGRIDLYKRGCFVLEAKQGSDQERAEEQAARALAPPTAKKSTKKKGTAVRGTKGWDDAMAKARGQAEAYAKALPAGEGWLVLRCPGQSQSHRRGL